MVRFTLGQTVRSAVVLAGLALMIGGGLASPSLAEVKTHKTIGQRTSIQVGNCEDLGGSADVETSYGSVTNGHQVIKTKVTCTGGGLDGSTCTNVKGSTNCTSSLVGGSSGPIEGSGQVIGVVQVVEQATAVPDRGEVNVGTVELKASTPTPLPTFGNPVPTITVEAVQMETEATATPVDTTGDGAVFNFSAQPVVIEQAP
ncbi:MAG TPA: hypothetical protein PK819_11290 [Thermomicrobiales bacterium]|nr:hypothetical protein [Thermomicrobiales bacterium]